MKLLILAMTSLSYMIYFLCNGSQEIHSQRKQHFSANPPLSNHTEINPSSTLVTEENSPSEDSNRYSAPLYGIAKITGSSSGENYEVLLSVLANHTPVGFAYTIWTVDNNAEENSPMSKASPSSDVVQDHFQTTQRRRMPLSRKSSISSTVSAIYHQYKFGLSDTCDLDKDSEITQSHKHFPTIGRPEAMFASDPTTHMQIFIKKLTALADEGTIDTSNANLFPGTSTTPNEETKQQSVFFIDSTAPTEKSIVIPRNFESLKDKEISSEEKSTFYTEVNSESEKDVFQETEGIPSSHNLNHFELENGGFDSHRFLPEAKNSKSIYEQWLKIGPVSLKILEDGVEISMKQNVTVMFVGIPIQKIQFKLMATETKGRSSDVSSGIKQNVKAGVGAAVSTPSISMDKIERKHSRPFNMSYDVISKSIIGDVKDPYATWETLRNKLSSTMHSQDTINLSNDYQSPTAKMMGRLANERKPEKSEVRNIFHGITGTVNSNFNKYKDKVKTDLASIIAASPLKKNIKINDFKNLKRKPNGLVISSGDHLKMSRDEVSVLSNVPFNFPQVTSPVKKLSWAAIMPYKTYPPNKTTTRESKAVMATASHDAENILNNPKYKSETSFEEDKTLNFEAILQNEEGIKSEEKNTLEEENVKDYVDVIPMEYDYISKNARPATTHYSHSHDAYDTTTFRETILRTRQPRFENRENVVSKFLLGRHNPEVQRKMVTMNSNSDSNHNELLSDTTYRMIQENVPNTYTFSPETMPKFIGRYSRIPMKGNAKPGKPMKGIGKTNLMTSFNLVDVTKMPSDATIISPYPSALDSKEDSDNSGASVPTGEEIRPLGLKSLLIPKQKISRTAVPFGGNGMLSDTAVVSEVSEPIEEHWAFIDQNWKVINEPGYAKPFPHAFTVPLQDSMSVPEKTVNSADIHTTENEDISEETDSMVSLPNIAHQITTNRKSGVNKAAEFISHHVQKTAVIPPVKERATSGNEAKLLFNNDKTDMEEKFYISEDNIPVNLEDLNTVKATPLLPKPIFDFAQQKGLENSIEKSYPGSMVSTTKLTQAPARDPLPLGNLDQPNTNSYTKFYHLTKKMEFSPTRFIINSNSKLDPACIGETIKITEDSSRPDDMIALSDNEILSPDDTAFIEDKSNILDEEKHVVSAHENDMTVSGVIPFMEISSAESNMEFQVGGNEANNMDLATIGLDESKLEWLSNENTFYAGKKEKSPTIRKPTIIQRNLYREIESPVPLSSTHVSENPSEENSVESKSKQKYKVWFLGGRNSDSHNNGAFVQDSHAPFYNKSPKFTTVHFLTNNNGKFSPKFSESFTLKGSSMHTGKEENTVNTHISDSEQMTAIGERRGFPSKITGSTIKPTTVTDKKQLPSKEPLSTAFDVLWEAKATMSPKLEYSKNKASRAESYNSKESTDASFPASINPYSEFSFAYEDSEANILKGSSSLSHVKKINTVNAMTSLLPKERNEWEGMMPFDENTVSRESPLLPSAESIIFIPEDLIKDFSIISDKPLADSSDIEPEVSDMTEFMDLFNEPDNQDSRFIRLQAGLYPPLALNSRFPHKTSVNVIRNSINNYEDYSYAKERENSMAEMPHSQDSSFPLVEFGVISNEEFSYNDDSEDLSNKASFPLSPMHEMHNIEDSTIADMDSNYKEEDVLLGEDTQEFEESMALQSFENQEVIPVASTEYPETSDSLISDF